MDKLTDKIRRPKQPAKHCSSRILFTLDYLSIQCENGQNSVADPDLQIRGRGRGHPDPETRGIPILVPVPVPVFGPQFGLKIRGLGPSPGSATEIIVGPWWFSAGYVTSILVTAVFTSILSFSEHF